MKKLFIFCFIVFIFSFFACNNTGDAKDISFQNKFGRKELQDPSNEIETPTKPDEMPFSKLISINIDKSGISFPIGLDDKGKGILSVPFEMATYETTYEIFEKVLRWAVSSEREDGRYQFSKNCGQCGADSSDNKSEPCTNVTWYDALVWCNAYSEYVGACPAYYAKAVEDANTKEEVAKFVVRSSVGADSQTLCEKAKILTSQEAKQGEKQNGFRLPSRLEWELCARLSINEVNTVQGKNGDIDGKKVYFTKGNSASGANTFFNDVEMNGVMSKSQKENNRVAVYKRFYFADANSKVKLGDNGTEKTCLVGSKDSTSFGFYDMSGNVFEWCIDELGSGFEIRGGAYDSKADELQIGKAGESWGAEQYKNVGFRVARTKK